MSTDKQASQENVAVKITDMSVADIERLRDDWSASVDQCNKLATELGLMKAVSLQSDQKIEDLAANLRAAQETVRQMRANLDEAHGKNDRLRHTVDSLVSERDQLQSDATATAAARSTAAGAELAAFKKRVAEVASRYAREHDWCGVVDQALAELGLERPSRKYQAKLYVEVQFEATLADDCDVTEVESHWVHGSIDEHELRNAIEVSFSMDGDHADTEIDRIEFRVGDVEMIED